MKKLALVLAFAFAGILSACNEEPKLNTEEETAVENQISDDQKAMDSLEAAIMNQMDALNSDTAQLDSLED